jgi:hypothetical protein
VRALAILTAAAALCGLMSAPIWAMPTINLVAASSVLVMAQSVRYDHRYPRYRLHSVYCGYPAGYYAYRAAYYYPQSCFGYAAGYGYGSVPFGYELVPGLYFRR